MTKKKKQLRAESDCTRLDPEKQVAPAFDSLSIKQFPAPAPEEMGFRVLDNFPEEHIQ